MVSGDSTLLDKLISMYYDSFISEHSGATVIVKKMKNIFYCKKQQKHMKQFVKECPIY